MKNQKGLYDISTDALEVFIRYMQSQQLTRAIRLKEYLDEIGIDQILFATQQQRDIISRLLSSHETTQDICDTLMSVLKERKIDEPLNSNAQAEIENLLNNIYIDMKLKEQAEGE